MSKEKKRSYNSENRNIQAEQTKKRILYAAQNLFQEAGFEAVTIDQLAKRAEVSSPTIYSLFQSKKGVLFALMDEVLPTQQIDHLIEEGRKETSPKRRITYAAKVARLIYDEERKQMDIFRGASVLAPEFKEIENQREHRRYGRLEDSIKSLAADHSLDDSINLSHAWDLLWMFTGRDIYRMLVCERGWTSDEYENWLSQHLVNTLIKEECR